jgi:hypothetical protein
MLRPRDQHVDDETLLAFQLDQLEQRRVLRVATHLQECDDCADRLDALNQGLEAAGELVGEAQRSTSQLEDLEDLEDLDAAPSARRTGLRLGIAGLGLLVGGGALGLLYHVSPGAAPSVGLLALAAVVTLALVLISVGAAQRLLTSGDQVFRRRYMRGKPARAGAGPGWTRSVVLGLVVLALLMLTYLLVLGPRAEPQSAEPGQLQAEMKR